MMIGKCSAPFAARKRAAIVMRATVISRFHELANVNGNLTDVT